MRRLIPCYSIALLAYLLAVPAAYPARQAVTPEPPMDAGEITKQAESAVQSAEAQLAKAQANYEPARKLGSQAIANRPALADVASDWMHGFFRETLAAPQDRPIRWSVSATTCAIPGPGGGIRSARSRC